MGRRPGTPKTPGSGHPNFQIGWKGGPGRPLIPEDVKGCRALNQIELERLLNWLIHLPMEELKDLGKNPETPSMVCVVCAIILLAVKNGDPMRIDFILNRLLGRVKDRVEVSGRINLEQLVIGGE